MKIVFALRRPILVSFLIRSYGKDPATKSDEFLEKFQTAFGPLLSFLENYIGIFYNGYGRIYARHSIRPDSIS